MGKLSKAQLRFLREHDADGWRDRWRVPMPTYDFVGRVSAAGLIEIIDGEKSGWPYSWEGTRITDAGRRALSPHGEAE